MVVAVSIPAYLLQHTITVEPLLGQTGQGEESFGPAVTLACFVEGRRRRVRTPSSSNSTGDEVLSTATAYCTDLNANAPVGSRVTLPEGRVAYVLEALRRDGGALPVPSHLELLIS